MAETKSATVKRLMGQMGVADLSSFWAEVPDNAALTVVNAQIGVQLDLVESEHQAMRDNLERLGRQQAALLVDLNEGVHADAMWIGHYSKRVVAGEAKINQALSLIRELMNIRKLLGG
jgi:hypothetical protein